MKRAINERIQLKKLVLNYKKIRFFQEFFFSVSTFSYLVFYYIQSCSKYIFSEKNSILTNTQPNIGIVSAYNDMLSAHKPLENFPKIIKAAANQFGATAQMAGGVPAMCDGITQGRPAMELSLMSRDVIAMSTAVSPSLLIFPPLG